MNGKTAKLIRKYSTATDYSRKSTKRGWLKTPRNQRWMNRKAIEQELE